MLPSTEWTPDKILTLWSYFYTDKVEHTSRKTALEQSSGAEKMIWVLWVF